MLLAEHELTGQEFRQISELVYRHCRIYLHDGKQELVRARLAKRLRAGGFDSVAAYIDHVQADPTGAEFTQLIDAISTNLTSFFREANHFAYLEEQFLPALLARKRREGSNRIRAWSAGCSSGEEPYSLAIVLRDVLDADGGDWDVKLLATDISTRVLAVAAAGVYEKARIEPVSPARRSRFLVAGRRDGRTAYQASDALKGMICFRQLNLMNAWPFTGPLDFVFCRNVMIYFDKPTQEQLVERFWGVLADGGMLFTGHSESLTGIRHRFRYVQPTIYVK